MIDEIDARELRIGNKVINNHTNTIYTVKSINVTDIGYSGFLNGHIWPLESVDGQPLDAYGIGFGVLDPILLTQEIIEKWFGFEKIDFDYFELKTENFYCHIDEQGFGFALEHDNFYICKYVHELQNLYFALMGKEITINV